MNSIKKIEFKLGFRADVSKQPTVHVGVYGTITVYMKDERVIRDLELIWDDYPSLRIRDSIATSGDQHNLEFRRVDLTNEEIKEIEEFIDDNCNGLWRPVVKASHEIEKIKVTGVLKTDVEDEYLEDVIVTFEEE